MSTLLFCSRCEGSIPKSVRVFHTRDGRRLCAECHALDVREKKEKAEHVLRERAGQQRATRPALDPRVRTNVLVGLAIVVLVGGFALAMAMRGGDSGAGDVAAKDAGAPSSPPVAAERDAASDVPAPGTAPEGPPATPPAAAPPAAAAAEASD